MPRKNLTTRFCETVKVQERTDYQDEMVRGLALRVSPNGTKTWNVVFTRESDGTKQRVKVGRFPAMPLEKARTAALKMVTAVSAGEDPSEEKRARKAAMTVEKLGELYIEKYAKRRKKTWAEDERLLKREVYPEIGRMKAVAVKRRDLLDIIEAKAEAGHVAQSTQILAVVRKMFNWAVDSDYLDASPAIGVKPRGKAVKRDRVLSDAEMRTIWSALPEAAVSEPTKDILRLLFLTGQRSGEVCGMSRGEVDTDRALWTIPGTRTKNGLAHVVPLSPTALEIVERALDKADDELDAPLFSRVGEPIESNAIAKAVRLKLQKAEAPWTPHDIRRTVATGMAALGIAPHIVEAVLNHISGFRAGVAGVYNRNQYEPEKRRALDMWAEHLGGVIEGREAKVRPLRRPEAV
ncbi:tyrosine-type recombinase/integrase [Chelativorans sp. M5D2P16]|uniref:tyrosine-type recombinase/integrase n=1 Tax=Chelativorans sp. M5D2P16 TaxID=3095678 RepID=UPI002ACAFEF6|nr:tyrosine-type recombinase/integrase [Chelativorans sp. M5D2P16]MDZ5697629.1 tyrosine-type recombinase/integrase [Chelativorans sp. M5D2P16]